MQQMHVSQPQHPHQHPAHWRPGHGGAHPAATSSRASSVMSEGSVDEDDHAEEQRENALIAEMEERYAREQAELLRRHTEQMQIAQERIQRRKAERERKSLLGGVAMSSASSASSIASLAEMHAAPVGAGYQTGAGGRLGAEIPGGRPPMPPVSPQGQGPPPPGTTPPGSPHVHQFHAHSFQQQQQVQPPVAQVVHAHQVQQQQQQQQQQQVAQHADPFAQHYQQQPAQVDPFAHPQHNQPNAVDPFAVQQPHYPAPPAGPNGVAATAPLAAPPGSSLPPSHPGLGPTAAHAGVAAVQNMVRVDSRHSVATSGGSGHNSADEGVGPKDAMFCLLKEAKDKDKAKAEKSAKAKEKLMDLEAIALLGLDITGGKSSKESKGEGMKSKTGLGMKDSMKAMKSTDSVASAAGASSANGTHNGVGSSADELNPQEAQVYEVKNTATAQAYDGDVPILPHQTLPQDANGQQ